MNTTGTLRITRLNADAKPFFYQQYLVGDTLHTVKLPASKPTPSVPPRDAEHLAYLQSMSDEGHVSPRVSANARAAWAAILKAVPGIMVPAAVATEEGSIAYYWDRGRYHFEAEFTAAGGCEWFYHDRDADQSGGRESPDGTLPDEFLDRLDTAFGPTQKA